MANTDQKILLIDTDPGTDDCAALMMALKQVPANVRIVGITCARGNVDLDKIQVNVARILKLCGLLGTIPVFRGCTNPLVSMPETEDASFFHGHDGLGDVPTVPPAVTRDLQNNVENESAVDAIIRLSKEHQGELQLVCLAAPTNIAMAERMDPDLPSRIKSVHIMGGTLRGWGNATPIAEFNIYTDPEAAYNVFRRFSAHCNIQVVTYELTLDYGIPVEWHKQILASNDKRATFYRSVHKYSQASEDADIAKGLMIGYSPCDAYLMAVVLNPDIITKSKMVRVGIELDGLMSRGAFIIDHKNIGSPHLTPKPIQLIEQLDMHEFKSLFRQAMQD